MNLVTRTTDWMILFLFQKLSHIERLTAKRLRIEKKLEVTLPLCPSCRLIYPGWRIFLSGNRHPGRFICGNDTYYR